MKKALTKFTDWPIPSNAVDPRVVVSNPLQSLGESNLLGLDDGSLCVRLNELLLAFELMIRDVFEGNGNDV